MRAATEQFVIEVFEGQNDSAGVPMSDHMRRVVGYLEDPDEETILMAWLHDVVEDTDVTFEDLAQRGYPPIVIEGLRLLTHDKKEMKYPEYIDRLCASKNARAIRVKLADQRDNTDPKRSLSMNPFMRNALQKKYQGVIPKLLEALNHC